MKTLRQTQQSVRAPELYGDQWFNSEPLSVHDSEGRSFLLLFWNYTSPSSLRMLSLVKEWHALYAEAGLQFIGVHVPEFSFASQRNTVTEALQRLQVTFPVVADNSRRIADAYRVTELPSLALVSGNGNIYDIVTSISSATRLERSIQYLLRQNGYFGDLPILQTYGIDPEELRTASEMTTGYLHGSLGNVEGYSPELPAEYQDPHIYVAGKFYAHGIWVAERNAFRYVGPPNEGYLICRSDGENIDVLVGAEQKAHLTVRLDDASLPLELMGSDTKRDAKGNTNAPVAEPQFLSLFRGKKHEQFAVKFMPSHAGVTVYKVSLFHDPLPADPSVIRNN